MDLKKFLFHATEYNVDVLRVLFEELHDVGEVGYKKLPKYCSGWHLNEMRNKVTRNPVPFEILTGGWPKQGVNDKAMLCVEVDLDREEVIIEIEYEGWRESLG